MASEGGSTGEGLLAVGIGALVWSLARVSSAMASQRATVTERLGTSLAVVRLLTSVHSLVDSQGRSLNEHLSAGRPVADVRSDAAVDALVSSEIAPSRKSFSASATGIGLDRLLGLLRLLRHVLHAHVRHSAHVGHIRVSRNLHRGWHGVGDVHGCMHRGW